MQWVLRMLLLSSVLSPGHAEDGFPAWFKNISTDLFWSKGDIMLGGIFPINELGNSSSSQREQPDDVHCDRVLSYGVSQVLVMKFAVDEINSSPLVLPDTSLGFEIYDSCRQPSVIMQPAMLFLSEGKSQSIRVLCNYTGYSTRVAAVIGPSTSEMVSITGKLFSFFLMPQISYSATSDKFSDKKQFPSFLRTVPSDRRQAEAMVQLVLRFEWNWIAVVGSEDEYGKQGLRQFSLLASQQSICIAYEALIPVYTSSKATIKDILQRINQTDVGVVVLFALPSAAMDFFSMVISSKMQKVWVGSTAWALDKNLVSMEGIRTVGTVLAFADRNQKLELFENYTYAFLSRLEREQLNGTSNANSTKTVDFPLADPCPSCRGLTLQNISMATDARLQRTAFSVYTAVYSVAHALHKLLKCNQTRCLKKGSVLYSWQLLEVLKTISFDINGTQFKFNEEGNPSIGYTVLTWIWGKDQVEFQDIGSYVEKLELKKELIKWHQSTSNEVPKSTCSANCQTGQVRRVKGFHSCCFDCIDCNEGTFQNRTEDFQCTDCPVGQWSTPRSNQCIDPTFHYLEWNQNESLGLVLGAVVVLACHAAVGWLFLRHWGSPLVCASGGSLSALALLSLSGGCASLSLFLGQPGDVVCRLQQPLNAIFPTFALATVLAISLQVIYVTEFPGATPSRLESLRGLGSWLVVLAVCSVQAGLCGWFVEEGQPHSQYVARMKVNFVESFLRCEVEPMVGFGLMYGFNGLLALVSFMCTFMAQKPAKQYNLARDITFSTLAYCVVWVVFIPIYTGLQEKTKSLAQMAAILLSNLGLLAAYFFPKCHLLLTTPDLNTLDYFRTYLEGAPLKQEDSQENQGDQGGANGQGAQEK